MENRKFISQTVHTAFGHTIDVSSQNHSWTTYGAIAITHHQSLVQALRNLLSAVDAEHPLRKDQKSVLYWQGATAQDAARVALIALDITALDAQ